LSRDDLHVQEPRSQNDRASLATEETTPAEYDPHATGTIHELSENAREQRLREILASPPPPDPAAMKAEPPGTPAKEPSLVERVTAPVANALGMGRKRPANEPADPRPDARENTRRREAASDTAGREPQDPDADVTPPQLLAAAFQPQEVRDGEATVLTITAIDNLSGVRSVSGVIASPSGSVQGFSSQREGESDRYVARIAIPKDAAEGVWHVRNLTLTDRASNSVNLNYSEGALPPTASFRVISPSSDTKAPILRNIWMERPAIRGRERNTIFVEAEDDQAGLAVVTGVFVSPRKQARLGFGCRASAAGSAWECGFTPPGCLDCGIWQLEQIQLQDKAGNLATFRTDDPIVARVHVDITAERCDAAPPVIAALTLSPAVVSNSEGGVVRLQAIVTDDGCGVAGLSGQAMPAGGTGGQRAYFSFEPGGDGQTYVANISIQKHAARGLWQIAWIQALDRGQNLRSYTAGDPIIAQATFRVE
jgi:hypothetical protein